MKTIYYIDSENVGDSWISLVAAAPAEDEILVFYTQNSPHMNYRNLRVLKETSRPVEFIECFEGSNALDFQLCTELGYRIRDIADDAFVIVSNDTGFDAVVKYWRKNGRAVKRVTGKGCAEQVSSGKQNAAPEGSTAAEDAPSPAPSMPALPAPENQTAPAAGKAQNAPAAGELDTGNIDQNAKEILYLIGRKNLVMLHEALQQIYGTKRATAIYNAFKKDNAYNSFLSSHPVLNTEEKQNAYCSIVFSTSAAKEPMPADFPQFAAETWAKKKNLNSFRSSLQQKYGKEKSEKYYSLFKMHIKILDTIK